VALVSVSVLVYKFFPAGEISQADERIKSIEQKTEDIKRILANGGSQTTQSQVIELKKQIDMLQNGRVPANDRFDQERYQTEHVRPVLLQKQFDNLSSKLQREVVTPPLSAGEGNPTPGEVRAAKPPFPCVGVRAPVLLSKVAPEYSTEANVARFQGTVVISFLVNLEGRAEDFHVDRPLGMGLDEKAIAAVRQWRFQPALSSCGPRVVHASAEVNFRLLDDALNTEDTVNRPVPKAEQKSATNLRFVTEGYKPLRGAPECTGGKPHHGCLSIHVATAPSVTYSRDVVGLDLRRDRSQFLRKAVGHGDLPLFAGARFDTDRTPLVVGPGRYSMSIDSNGLIKQISVLIEIKQDMVLLGTIYVE